jgi:hypothetical protein
VLRLTATRAEVLGLVEKLDPQRYPSDRGEDPVVQFELDRV